MSALSLSIVTASPVQDETLYKCRDFHTSDLHFALHSRADGKVTWTSVVEKDDLMTHGSTLFQEAETVLKQTQLKHDFDLAEVKLHWRSIPYIVPASIVVTFLRDPARTEGQPFERPTLTLAGLPFHKLTNTDTPSSTDSCICQYSSYVEDVSTVNITAVTGEATQLCMGDVTVGLTSYDMDVDIDEVHEVHDSLPSVKVGHREEKRAKRTRTCPPRACKRLRL